MRWAVLAAVLGLGFTGGPGVPGAAPAGRGGFSGYASGAVVAAGAVEPSTSGGVLQAALAVSAASVSSTGAGGPASDELGLPLRPPAGAARSYSRGSGVELTAAGLPLAGPGGLLLPATVEAAGPPSSPLLTREIAPVPPNPVVFASALRGQAQPQWSDRTCVLGQPLAYALGHAADARLLDLGGDGALAALEGGSPANRAVAQSRSFTSLQANGDGTFGLVSETRQTLAPVTLFAGTSDAVTIEVLGELVLRATATGRPGEAHVARSVAGDPAPQTPVMRLSAAGQVHQLTVEEVIGPEPVTVSLTPVVEAVVGGRPRAPAAPGHAAAEGSGPDEAPDGTRAAGAIDLVRVTAVHQPPADRPRLAHVRLGHMEALAAVPAGGVRCPLPVRKSGTPAFVAPGGFFTWTISIPDTPAALEAVSCDLVDIRAVDVASATTGVDFTLHQASHGGRIEGPVVRWDGLGSYRPGGPSLTLTVEGRVAPGSAGGFLRDTVEVSAGLGRCTGGAAGEAVAGSPESDGPRLRGSFTLRGPAAGDNLLH